MQEALSHNQATDPVELFELRIQACSREQQPDIFGRRCGFRKSTRILIRLCSGPCQLRGVENSQSCLMIPAVEPAENNLFAPIAVKIGHVQTCEVSRMPILTE